MLMTFGQSRLPATVAGIVFAIVVATLPTAAQHTRPAESNLATTTSADHTVLVRYPKSLKVCAHRDGENPDVWSPEDCAAEIPVCDNSGHSGNVLVCLAYPAQEFHGSNLQAAAFAVSRIDNFRAKECSEKWPRTNTSDIHSTQIAGMTFNAAKAQETANSHVSAQSIYRIAHNGTCYELDVNFTTALDTAFATEDVPRKLTAAERARIRTTLLRALAGVRFAR
jgi:hypothetical protein